MNTEITKAEFEEFLKQHNKLVDKYREPYCKKVAEIIKRHYSTLETKYKQLVYTDDYGNEMFDDFFRELDYFIDNVLLPEAPIDFVYIDSELSDSYKKIHKEFMRLSSSSRTQIEKELGQVWSSSSFFCFKILHEETKNIPPEENGKITMDFTLIVEEFSDLEVIERFYSLSYAGRLRFSLRCMSYMIFSYIQSTCEKVKNAVGQVLGPITQTHEIPDNPLEYETYISNCLKDLGFMARTTKSTGDQGADVLASKDGVSFAIQCKMYSKPVGNKAVQEANAGRDFYKKDYGVVVSNAGFTKSARQAAHACGIILLNDNQLDDLLEYVKPERE